MDNILEVKNIMMCFKGVTAVNNVSMNFERGRLYGLIGTNGAGKTTVINMLSGVLKPTSGRILYNGTDITGKGPDKIAEMGITRTYQNLRLFKNMTVLDNVIVGAEIHKKYATWEAILITRNYRKQEKYSYDKAMEMLKIMQIDQYANELAGSLPYGCQRRLEIARSLAADAKLILLDEPAAGMNPQESKELTEIIRKIVTEFGLTALLIEHDMKVVMGLCEYIYTMAAGEVIAEGLPEEIRNNKQVIEAYLGRKAKEC